MITERRRQAFEAWKAKNPAGHSDYPSFTAGYLFARVEDRFGFKAALECVGTDQLEAMPFGRSQRGPATPRVI